MVEWYYLVGMNDVSLGPVLFVDTGLFYVGECSVV